MSETNDTATYLYENELLERARARGARRMVLQGLTLYYQSLLHRVHEDSPSFFEGVLEQAQRNGRSRPH